MINKTILDNLKSRLDLKALFIDFNDTIVDYDKNEYLALNKLFSNELRDEVELSEVINQFRTINIELWKKYQRNEISTLALRVLRFQHLSNFFNFRNSPEILSTKYLELFRKNPVIIDGAVNFLKYVKFNDIKVAIVTNGFKDTQKSRIDNLNISKYIDFLITSEDVGKPKPFKDIFHVSLEKFGLTKNHVVMIGDNVETDIEGAINSEIVSIHLNRNGLNYDKIKPTITIRNFEELKVVVDHLLD
jgi:YjjG family noncanonical pyrimidine nucleotidase